MMASHALASWPACCTPWYAQQVLMYHMYLTCPPLPIRTAMLTVEDEAFWAGVEPVSFGELPQLQDAVTVVG